MTDDYQKMKLLQNNTSYTEYRSLERFYDLFFVFRMSKKKNAWITIFITYNCQEAVEAFKNYNIGFIDTFHLQNRKKCLENFYERMQKYKYKT